VFRRGLWRTLSEGIRSIQTKLLLWHFHTVPHDLRSESFASPILHLGEDLYPEAIDADDKLREFRRANKVLALKYSSPLHPLESVFLDVPRTFDFNFVGHGYRRELTAHCERRYRSLIRNTPPVISEALRVNSFRRAEVNLVFHSGSNVTKGTVVERFAEALSLGGIVFHDHPRIAVDFPDLPSLKRVHSTDDIDRAFNEIMAYSPPERTKLRRLSFDAWRQSGLSYYDQAGRILNAYDSRADSAARIG
jgi:hypothetical protein